MHEDAEEARAVAAAMRELIDERRVGFVDHRQETQRTQNGEHDDEAVAREPPSTHAQHDDV